MGAGMFSGFLAFGSLCGAISLAWLLVQYRTQARQRLRITTARTGGGDIDVLIQYRPMRTRVGLSAKVFVVAPDTAQLAGGIREERADRFGAYAAKIPVKASPGRSIEVGLRHLEPDPPGVFSGVFYVSDAGGAPINAASVRVEVWTEVGPSCLAAKELPVRAINW